MHWIKQNWHIGVLILIPIVLLMPTPSQGYGDCSGYGIWATYDYLSGGCKCMSGYVFGKDFLGNTTCVDGDSICSDKYGYHSRYDSSSNSCECSYGYIFGKDSIGRTQCVSPDSLCENQLGFNSRYNSLSDTCECSYGYVISNGRCQDGDFICHSKHGIYSSYKSYNNACECDSGYTLDDSDQCVKKQNNVYFTLKELDTNNKEAVIRSDYDLRYYFIKYNSGCYSSSFRRYLNNRIVINLGTDFELDTWDRIVLQDDDETCDITYREKVSSSFSLEEGEDVVSYFIGTPISTPKPTQTQTPVIKKVQTPTPIPKLISQPVAIIKPAEKTPEIKTISQNIFLLKGKESLRECPSKDCAILRSGKFGDKVELLEEGVEWYKVAIYRGEDKKDGWIHSSLIPKQSKTEFKLFLEEQKNEEQKKNSNLMIRFFGWFF